MAHTHDAQIMFRDLNTLLFATIRDTITDGDEANGVGGGEGAVVRLRFFSSLLLFLETVLLMTVASVCGHGLLLLAAMCAGLMVVSVCCPC